MRSLAAAIALALTFATPARAIDVDGASVEAAKGRASKMLRLGLQRDIQRTWLRSGRHHLGAYWDLTAAHWRGDAYRDQQGVRQELWDIGLTPVLRYRRNDKLGWYGEAGIGLHYLSDIYDNGGDSLSTRFQFGDHLGIGYVFRNGLDLTVKFQHFSNGGMKDPNIGANFVILKAGLRF